MVIADIKNDPRCKFLTVDDSINSALLVPVAAEDEIFGIIAVFHQQIAKFDGGDVMLIGAAANQIGLAARQANLFAAYRKQTKNLTVLYRMSHELSHLLPLEEIFMQAFTIIRDELGLKRLWLGLLNESGNRDYWPGCLWARLEKEISRNGC